MALTIAARLHELASNIEALQPEVRERDIPDELVPKLVMNAFTDDRPVEAFRVEKAKETST
jgi:hypothetical protein